MWIHSDTVGAEVRSLHSPKRDHLAAIRVTTDVGAFLRNHANGRAQGTNDGSVSSTHCVLSLLLQTAPTTKLLPVVQLRSGVILLMGDPIHDLLDNSIHTPSEIRHLVAEKEKTSSSGFPSTVRMRVSARKN